MLHKLFPYGRVVLLKEIRERFFPATKNAPENLQHTNLLLKLAEAEENQSQPTEIQKQA